VFNMPLIRFSGACLARALEKKDRGELRSERWEGASKASRGPQQAQLAGVEEGEAL
jgi:hypothetical protein